MTAEKCINLADKIIKNGIDDDIKIEWLAEFDGRIEKELQGFKPKDNLWYRFIKREGTAIATEEMIIPFPYDGMYVNALLAEIYQAIGERKRAENELEKLQAKYNEFSYYISREFPKTKGVYFKTEARYSV